MPCQLINLNVLDIIATPSFEILSAKCSSRQHGQQSIGGRPHRGATSSTAATNTLRMLIFTQQSARPGSYVYRGDLLKQTDEKNRFTTRSVIIKHTSEILDNRSWAFEEALLQSLAKLAPESHSAVSVWSIFV